MKTLQKLYKTVILAVSFTAPLISFVCLALLTPTEVGDNLNHLLSGLTYKIGGVPLKTLLVINASLTLFAATNTSLVGFYWFSGDNGKKWKSSPDVFKENFT